MTQSCTLLLLQKKNFYLRKNTPDYVMGAVLMQDHDGPVCYAVKTLSNTEPNYSKIEECLAIVCIGT